MTESGDAHWFTQSLAALAAAQGAVSGGSSIVERIEAVGGEVQAVHAGDQRHVADAYVLSCGSRGPPMLASAGYSPAPVYPAKGYSATLTLAPEHRAQRELD